ncbi:MAG: peptide-binding protein [Deltaproteobacteria bacterium]|nr:peptide-binding protein [Deltaproteobacteria bacterium]
MTIKKILIIAPTLVIIFLLQSYLWVPTYEEQTRGNPKRLTKFITASIGDASMLNPILSADTASSSIESLVFEGLVDRDENLHFRGRLAISWEIHEEAFFYVNEKAAVPGLGEASSADIKALLTKAINQPGLYDITLQTTLKNIKEIAVLPSRSWTTQQPYQAAPQKGQTEKVEVTVDAPAGIKLMLQQVDQDLFENLSKLLGENYFSSFSSDAYLSFGKEISDEQKHTLGRKLLSSTEHNPIVTFHLRPDVKFHDGHILDAGDVKFTYESIINPKNLSPRISDYEPVKRVEVIDDLTVRVTYKRLYSPALGTWAMGILPEHLLNKTALEAEAEKRGKDPAEFSLRQSLFNRNPLGSGPFVFKEWKSDQYIALDRFEGYWEGAPNYEHYMFRIIPDLLTQEIEFYAGTIDNYGVQPHQVERLSQDPTYQHFSGPSFGYSYIGYNIRREPFNDVRVRRALGMAIDVDKIIKYVLYEQGERITGPFVKQTDYYDHNIKPIPYDPEGALALLNAAGWQRNQAGWLEKDGKKLQFTLITNNGNPLRKDILAIAQDAWKKIGIDVRTDLLEWSVFIQERVDKGDFDALILGWSMGIEPDLYQIWHSSQTNPYQLNFVGFKNKEADDLIIRIRKEYNHDKQVAYSHRLHEIIAREQPYTFLYVAKWTAILDKRIVIKQQNDEGQDVFEAIKPTKTGSYNFYFNRWIKLSKAPYFALDG